MFPQRGAVQRPRFELRSLPPATWHLADPRSWRRLDLPWPLPPLLALGPLCSTLKWNVCPLSSMPSTTLVGGGGKGREACVSVTVELFQLSPEPADDPGMRHESSLLAEAHVGSNTRALWTGTYPYLGLTGWLRDTLWIQMVGAGG